MHSEYTTMILHTYKMGKNFGKNDWFIAFFFLFQRALCQEIDPEDLKWVDPVVKKEYMDWIKAPNLDKNLSKFLKRLYLEDIEPCMTFPNESLALKIIQSIESNTLSISPIVLPKNSSGEMPNFCALFNTSLMCQYKLVIEKKE